MSQSVQDEMLHVLSESAKEDRWMKRSEIVREVYGKGVPVNAYHRLLLERLVASGQVEKKKQRYMHSTWFVYQAVR
jgi:hypothetical protein